MPNPRYPVTSGTTLRCKGWRQEGLLRLMENVLSVGEDPDSLIVYAALGKAARNWAAHDAIVKALKTMDEDETLIVQSGKPIGLLKTQVQAPIVIMANCNIVGQWAKAEYFYELERKGLICWGGLTAGAWQYIGSQGVIQGTYEIFMRIAEKHFGGDLRGTLHPDRRPRRHGRVAAAGRPHGQRRHPHRRRRPRTGGKAQGDRLCRRDRARPRHGAAAHRARPAITASRSPSRWSATRPRSIPKFFGAASIRTSSPTRPRRMTSSMAMCRPGFRSPKCGHCVRAIRQDSWRSPARPSSRMSAPCSISRSMARSCSTMAT